jgi:hypothetical protein
MPFLNETSRTSVWETVRSGLSDSGILTKLHNTRPQRSSKMTPVEFEEFNILTLVSCRENKSIFLLILGISLIMLLGQCCSVAWRLETHAKNTEKC